MGLSLLAFFFPNGILTGLGNLVGIWFLVEMVSVLVFLVRVARLRTPVAWFFVMGSILVFGGGFGSLVVSSIFGIMDNNALGLLISLTLEIVVFSLGLGYKMRQQQKDKIAAEQALNQELQKINTAFGRFVPHAFLESLGHKSVLDVKLGDQVEKDVTVLFSDIRGYTTLAEGMTPQENFNFLNAYLGRMGPIIQANHGFVNQYYGDGIMALFMGEPADALRASIEMQQALAQYNALREQKGRLPIQIGIGLHTGPLMMGIIGDTLRLEAGVVSDTVNTAARMEGLTKHFGVRLLLSETTESRLGDTQTFGLRLLGKVQVKGRQQPLRVYQAYDGETEAFRNLQTNISALFEAALHAYFEGNFAEAVALWEQVAQQAPDDLSTQHYLTQSRAYLQSGKPESWEGVEVMQKK
jgi:class 3 adenylate cyclase